MKFYNRKQELKQLDSVYHASKRQARLVVIRGRRRIGKTTLALKSVEKRNSLYLFVTRKKADLLLDDFEKELKNFGFPLLGHLESFEDFFQLIFEYSKKNPLILILDEFQNFRYVDPSVFSVLQKYWDKYKDESKIALVIIGSMVTLMKKIFLSRKEPLFGRATDFIQVAPLDIEIVTRILADLKLKAKNNLLYYYAIFGGVPKYYDLLDRTQLRGSSLEIVLEQLIFKKDAPLQEEGEILLIEEFGKNYLTYFSILEAMAQGQTQLTKIANKTGIPVASMGKYMKELKEYYQLIERRPPLLSKPNSRISRYYIRDNFLRFWFRYAYKNKGLLEQGRNREVLQFLFKDLTTFCGTVFENMIKQILIERNKNRNFLFSFDVIGNYWGRADFDIDVVAANEKTKEIFFGECKLNSQRVDEQLINSLKENAAKCKWNLNSRKEYFGVFVADKMDREKKKKLSDQGIYVWEFPTMIDNLKF